MVYQVVLRVILARFLIPRILVTKILPVKFEKIFEHIVSQFFGLASVCLVIIFYYYAWIYCRWESDKSRAWRSFCAHKLTFSRSGRNCVLDMLVCFACLAWLRVLTWKFHVRELVNISLVNSKGLEMSYITNVSN